MSDKSGPGAPNSQLYCSFSFLVLVVDNSQTCVRAFSFCAENINDSAYKTRSDKMPHRNGKIRVGRALTIMEMVMAIAIITRGSDKNITPVSEIITSNIRPKNSFIDMAMSTQLYRY